MKPWMRKTWGVAGALVAVAAVAPLLVGGLCAYVNVTEPRGDFNPGLDGLWGTVPIAVVSALVIWGGIRLCLWGFRRRQGTS
ncbi:MAG: hypothetical protein ACM3Q1_13285 [Bacteroidales bacterium]